MLKYSCISGLVAYISYFGGWYHNAKLIKTESETSINLIIYRGGRKLTSGIYLKKFLSEDDFQYFLTLVSNEKVMEMHFETVFQLEDAKRYYKHLLENNNDHKDFGSFKVFETATNNFIGLGELSISEDLTEADIEFVLLPDYRGNGYGREIVGQLLKKAEETKSIQRVRAVINPNFIASKKVLLSTGFVSCEIFESDNGLPGEILIKEIIAPVI